VDHYRETMALLNRQEAAIAQFFPTTSKRVLAAR